MEKTIINSEMKTMWTGLTSSQRVGFFMKRGIHKGTPSSIVNSLSDKNLFPIMKVSGIITSSFNDQPALVWPLHFTVKLYLGLNRNIIINKEPKSKTTQLFIDYEKQVSSWNDLKRNCKGSALSQKENGQGQRYTQFSQVWPHLAAWPRKKNRLQNLKDLSLNLTSL